MNDEQKIRDLIETWMQATKAGDLPRLLTLMDEDVVFLVAGQIPMRGRTSFAESFRSATKQGRIEATSDIQEIQVAGNWAYLWNHLTVTMQPAGAGAPMLRTGYTLTILRKNPAGDWQIIRDANLLTPIAAPAPQ